MPVTISSFKKNLKSSAEKEDKSSPRRFPGTYAPPAQGMPQTFHDFNLNVRLQSLIEGELQLGTRFLPANFSRVLHISLQKFFKSTKIESVK